MNANLLELFQEGYQSNHGKGQESADTVEIVPGLYLPDFRRIN